MCCRDVSWLGSLYHYTWTDRQGPLPDRAFSEALGKRVVLHLELDNPLALVGSDGYELSLGGHISEDGTGVCGKGLVDLYDRYYWLIFVH